MIEKFKNCTSKSNDTGRRKKKGKKAAKQYIPLVGDPCYNYSREAKERFFRNGPCAFLFLLAKDHMETQIRTGKLEARSSEVLQILDDYCELARQELNEKKKKEYLRYLP